ncbi:MAG: hypothetical protein ACR2JC_08340 [Chloroflexota bacterium]
MRFSGRDRNYVEHLGGHRKLAHDPASTAIDEEHISGLPHEHRKRVLGDDEQGAGRRHH